jgi:hypothetical protein
MKINNFFPTKILTDFNLDFASRLLPLCEQYVAITDTNLESGQGNYPTTLSNGELNDQVNNEPDVKEFFEFIIESYARPLIESKNVPYERSMFKPYGFFSSMRKHAYLSKHAHQYCTFSGTFYLEIGTDVPPLVIHDPRPHSKFDYNQHQSQITLRPQTGLIVMWDNWLEHEVAQKTNDEPRKVFSFNI